jgi:hypothetical protein
MFAEPVLISLVSISIVIKGNTSSTVLALIDVVLSGNGMSLLYDAFLELTTASAIIIGTMG